MSRISIPVFIVSVANLNPRFKAKEAPFEGIMPAHFDIPGFGACACFPARAAFGIKLRQSLYLRLLDLALDSVIGVRGAELSRANHPNLLLNAAEIEGTKQKVRSQPWTATLFEELKAGADG